jgi:hypothetical protein
VIAASPVLPRGSVVRNRATEVFDELVAGRHVGVAGQKPLEQLGEVEARSRAEQRPPVHSEALNQRRATRLGGLGVAVHRSIRPPLAPKKMGPLTRSAM